MLSLVPILFFIIIFFVFQKVRTTPSWRISFLSASLVWGLLLTATTEFLSLFKLISFWVILGAWVLSVTLAIICLTRLNHVNSNERKSNLHISIVDISRFDLLLLAGIALIIIIVGVTGWISPPNNWDSMTYHMSRVMHWIQNGSVAYYPTHTLRQLHQNPWAEFAILHFQILSGSDRFANLIQWFSMIGVTLGVSLIAKQLGASSRGQVLAAVISVTIPMGILQGSSTQNDYVVSFWLVCFTYFAILLKENGKPLYSFAVGASLGLAILTKATTYIYAFPFMVWIGLLLLKSRRIKGLILIALIVIIATAINFGQYTRNYDLYLNPLGPGKEGETKYSNDIFTIPSVTSNVIRNIGLHIGTSFGRVNSILENGIYMLHRVLGIDPNDIRTTWPGTEFHISLTSLHEDYAGNLPHLILIISTIPIIVLQQRKQKDSIYYLVSLVGAFILLSLCLKWQPWNSRLHLPLFILWSSLIGLSLSKIKLHYVANLFITILLLAALPYVLKNQSRPIIGQDSILATSRTELYFKNRSSLTKPYINSVQFVLKSQCSDIGLILGDDDWEYPFFVLLHENNNRTIRIEHVNVTNISQVKSNEYPFNVFTPCAIIVVSNNLPNEVNIDDVIYLRKMFSDPIGVFMQK
jgi:4-amino-4-deoxy-L-arabinose transferase-like glycosyltransferase